MRKFRLDESQENQAFKKFLDVETIEECLKII